jgi:hypothetical protein
VLAWLLLLSVGTAASPGGGGARAAAPDNAPEATASASGDATRAESAEIDESTDAETAADAEPSPIPALDLTRPVPAHPSTRDWIQLKSGEWLRGSVKRMRDASLDFDSDELDDQTFDWKDVSEVRSPILHTYVFERDREQFSVTGPAHVDKTKVWVRLGDEVHEFPREELVAILRGERRRDLWSGSLSFGLTWRQGNTNQLDFSGIGWLRRETDRTRARLDYNGAFGTVNGGTNSNNHRFLFAFDIFITRKLYLTPARMEVFKDDFQNVEYRLTPSVGVGYKLVRWRTVEWDVDFGGGYQYTDFASVAQGEPGSQSGGALIFGTRFESDITKRTDIAFNYKLNLAITGSAQTSHHAELMFSVDLWRAIDLDLTLIWDHIQDPAPDANGDIPEDNDGRLVIGLGIDF